MMEKQPGQSWSPQVVLGVLGPAPGLCLYSHGALKVEGGRRKLSPVLVPPSFEGDG